MKKYASILFGMALLSVTSCSEDHSKISVNITYIPLETTVFCATGSHLVHNICVDDTVDNCGEANVDCTNLPGWISGICRDALCAVDQCAPQYHIQNGLCVYDTNDCCGNDCTACAEGLVCSNGFCASSCDFALTYCQNGCFDLKNSVQHCGACDHNCSDYLPEHAELMSCIESQCVTILCAEGYKLRDGMCVPLDEPGSLWTSECQLGQSKPCYTGESVFENVGACHAGHYNCIQNESGNFVWDVSSCIDEVLPTFDFKCEFADQDLDCNGIPDSQQDEDGDGYTVCSMTSSAWDCCDNPKMCNTAETAFVHPGQKGDCYGNTIDDNCNGLVDESPEISCSAGFAACAMYNESCDASIEFNYNTTSSAENAAALSLAQAMDLCIPVVDLSSNEPGIIEYSLTQADDVSKINPMQVNIKDAMRDASGTSLIFPQAGSNFVLLSSGAAEDRYNRSTLKDENCSSIVGVQPPAVYQAVHGKTLMTHEACSSQNSINDSVKLHLKLRAPLSANGFKFDFRFFSREYPSYVCSPFNDFFLTIMTDEFGKPIIDINKNGSLLDEDGNITFDSLGNPITVNSSLFSTCKPITCDQYKSCPNNMTCSGNTCNECVDGDAELSAFPTTGGGATGWLTTSAPIEPGKVFNLDFYIWDTGDSSFDSTVIIDNFRWTCATQIVETDFAKPNN